MNVVDLFEDHDPAAVAFVCGDARQTFGELAESVAVGRTALMARVDPGSNVAVMGATSIAFVETVFAALSAGLAVLPLHARYPAAEMKRALDLVEPALLITTDASAEALAAELSVESCRADELQALAGERGSPVDLDADHPALLIFTSGTAGSPRIAVLSHKNIAASIRSSVASVPESGGAQHTVLGVMPLTHVLGIVSVVAVAVTMGSTTVLSADLDVETVLALVEREQVTMLVAPPVFWFRLAGSAAPRDTLASVMVALSGAAPLPGSTARAIAEHYGCNLRQGYGLTEASPGLTTSVGTEAPSTSVGRPMPGVQLRLVDEFGDDALVGDVGEIWAKGDNVFAGYLGDDQATADVVDADGWLRTGDLAVVDEAGFLYIVGRNKDQIIVSGFNVHPGEVEDHLALHPHVEAAAVVGHPDREYGEVVVAYVVTTPGAKVHKTELEAELEAHCRERLAGYKVPARFEFVSELPRSPTGKLRRRVLRS